MLLFKSSTAKEMSRQEDRKIIKISQEPVQLQAKLISFTKITVGIM